jgi:hypothetical protein
VLIVVRSAVIAVLLSGQIPADTTVPMDRGSETKIGCHFLQKVQLPGREAALPYRAAARYP